MFFVSTIKFARDDGKIMCFINVNDHGSLGIYIIVKIIFYCNFFLTDVIGHEHPSEFSKLLNFYRKMDNFEEITEDLLRFAKDFVCNCSSKR